MQSNPQTSRVFALLKTYVENERRRIPIEAAWLYGSMASGVPAEESDIDIAIVTTTEITQEMEIEAQLDAKAIDPMIDVVFFSSAVFASARKTLVEEIKEKGIRII